MVRRLRKLHLALHRSVKPGTKVSVQTRSSSHAHEFEIYICLHRQVNEMLVGMQVFTSCIVLQAKSRRVKKIHVKLFGFAAGFV